MGNACCKSANNDDEDNDRAQIMYDDHNYDTPQVDEQGIEFYVNFNGPPSSEDIPYGSFSCGNKTQEQAALDRIYHKLALNVIDVAPGDTMIIQPDEIYERQQAYQSRMNQLGGLLSLSLLTKTGGFGGSEQNLFKINNKNLAGRLEMIPSDSRNFEPSNTINRQKLYQIPDRRRVEYEAIPQDEEELIREYSLRTTEAVKSLAPTVSEPVITQFDF